MNASTRFRFVFLLPALIFIAIVCVVGSPAPARAEEMRAPEPALPRSAWWPFSLGPHYGELAEERRVDPRVIRLEVGSFDTRGAGLSVPESLRAPAEQSARPSAPWLVQLQGPITEEKKDALRTRGVRFYSYYPTNTFVVKVPSPSALATMPGVLWAGPLHPAYRIDPLLGQAPTMDPVKARNERIFVRVLLFEPSEREAVISALESVGAMIDRSATFEPHEYADRIYFTATPQMILAAARMDEVRWVEEVSLEGFTMNAESKVVLQSGSIAGGTPYWDAGVNGSTQILGDMDEGLNVDVIAMSNTATDAGTPGPSHRKVRSYTAWGGGDTRSCSCWGSGYSHGTNTAQCAVGNRSDLGQTGDLDGVAKMAKVVFQDISPSTQIPCLVGSLSPPASLIAMYDQVRSFGGHLSNGSFSICSGYGNHALDADQYTWDHKDFLMTFSAGNGGNGLVCPGTAKNVIAAGGHYQDPFANEFYGAAGPGPSGRMGPTVMAPACDHSNGNPAPYNYNTSATYIDNDCDSSSNPPSTAVNQGSCGTSFSSPYSMAAGALIRDYFEKGYYPSGAANAPDAFAPSGAMVKAVLLNSGEWMSCCGDFMSSSASPSYGQGMGRIKLTKTLVINGDSRTPIGMRAIDKGAANGVATGGVYEEQISISDATKPFRATANWADRPGTALVNDLRLTVIGPAGTPAQTYHGGNFAGNLEFTKSEAAGGTANDSVNPFEAVFIRPSELVTGNWKVRVEGTNVPNGDPNFGNTQPFALIVSGGFASSGVREVSPLGSLSPLKVVSASGTSVTWQWENIGDPSATYSFYRGNLPASPASWAYNHAMIDAAHCGISANTTSVNDRLDGLRHYYLVAMKKSGTEGSLGKNSAGAPRPPASPACP